MIEQSAGLCTM